VCSQDTRSCCGVIDARCVECLQVVTFDVSAQVQTACILVHCATMRAWTLSVLAVSMAFALHGVVATRGGAGGTADDSPVPPEWVPRIKGANMMYAATDAGVRYMYVVARARCVLGSTMHHCTDVLVVCPTLDAAWPFLFLSVLFTCVCVCVFVLFQAAAWQWICGRTGQQQRCIHGWSIQWVCQRRTLTPCPSLFCRGNGVGGQRHPSCLRTRRGTCDVLSPQHCARWCSRGAAVVRQPCQPIVGGDGTPRAVRSQRRRGAAGPPMGHGFHVTRHQLSAFSAHRFVACERGNRNRKGDGRASCVRWQRL